MDERATIVRYVNASGNYQTAMLQAVGWIPQLDALRVLQLTNNNLLVWHGAFYPQSGDTPTISTPLSKTLSGLVNCMELLSKRITNVITTMRSRCYQRPFDL